MYSVVRDENNKLILDEEGNVLVKDNDNNVLLWVEQAFISYNEKNQPVVQIPHSEVEGTEDTQDIHEAEPLSDISNISNVNEKGCAWSYENTLVFITSMEAHFDEMHHPEKRKNFWNIISEELISQNIQVTPLMCQRKWNNLVRSYRSTKDNKKKTGRAPTRFHFFNRMDELLGDKPNISSPHSIDVSQITNECMQPGTSRVTEARFTCSTGGPSTGTSSESQIQTDIEPVRSREIEPSREEPEGKPPVAQRRNVQAEYLKSKTNYYKTKTESLLKKQEAYEKHLAVLQETERHKAALYERKVKSDEKRAQALSEMVTLEKERLKRK